MNTSHAKAIKGMSIANIVLASLGIIGILIAWADRKSTRLNSSHDN